MAALLLAGGEGLYAAAIDNSLAIVDSGTPANDYSGTPGAKLTTTRASSAAYWTASGAIAYAASGELRRDFDPRLSSTVERCGYLIEEARTNLALRSEAFDNASWTKNGTTVTADQSVAPDGTTTADLVSSAAGATPSEVYQSITITAAANTWSIFVKAGTAPFFYLSAYDGAARISWFNMSTFAVATQAAGNTSTITSVGNGWYRVTVTRTAGTTAGYLVFGVSDADNSTAVTSGRNVTVWGAQLELGSFASSYIPTAASTVTRAADLVTLAGTLFPLNQDEGTLYAKIAPVGTSSSAVQYSLSIGASGNLHALYRGTDKKPVMLTQTSGISVVSLGAAGVIADLAQGKSAIGYKVDDCAAAHIGETVQSDNSCAMPTLAVGLTFGNRSDGARPANCWLFEAAYFPTRKTNSELQALSSGYASDALLLMGAETQGLTFAATDQTMSILDTGTPANAYTGELSAKLGSIRTSAGMTYLSSGLLGWGPENIDARSEDFENAVWDASNAALLNSQADGPRGALTMASYIESSSAGCMSRAVAHAAVAGTPYVVSRVFKRMNCDWLCWYIGDNLTPTNGMRVWFNLATGVVGSNTSQGSGYTYTSAIMTDLGGGAYRVSVAFITGGAISVRMQTAASDTSTSKADIGAGAGIGSGFYIDMAQTERALAVSTYKAAVASAYYGLRLDYDTRLTGGPGYLVEEARTNLGLRSQELDNATWTATRTSISANAIAAPDGTTTADKIVEDSTAANTHVIAQIVTYTATTWTYSIYLKAAGRTWARLAIFDGTTAYAGYYNLSSGVVGTFSNATGTIQSVGNGWYRCTVTTNAATAAAAGTIGINISEADNDSTFDGNGTDGIYAWGAQLEAGAFATSYIPTTTATVTRAADVPNIAATSLPTATSGTLAVRAHALDIVGSRYLASFDDGSSSDRVGLRYSASDPFFTVNDGGVTQANLDLGTAVAGAMKGMAGAWALNDFAASYEGGAVGTDVGGTPPTPTVLALGGLSYATTVNLCGWLRHGRYFPTRKSNADLAVLAAAA